MARGTVFHEVRPGAGFKTGDGVEEKGVGVGGATVERVQHAIAIMQVKPRHQRAAHQKLSGSDTSPSVSKQPGPPVHGVNAVSPFSFVAFFLSSSVVPNERNEIANPDVLNF